MGIIKACIAGVLVSFSGFIVGASLGWSGPVEPHIIAGDAYDFSATFNEFCWACSLLAVGAACMCLPAGFLLAGLGRKVTILLMVWPNLVGNVLLLCAKNVMMLYVGRFLIGVCLGGYCVATPTYITELVEVRVRGNIGCCFQLMLVHGVLYMFVLGAFVSVHLLNIFSGILPLILFIFVFWLPESPIHLLQKGKKQRAEKALRWLRGADADITSEMATFAEQDTNKEKITFRQAFARKTTLKGLFLCIGLVFFQQLTGINAVVFFITTMFETAETSISAAQCTLLIGVVHVVATMLATVVVDRAGRKILLIVSGIIVILTTMLMAVYLDFWMSKNVSWLSIVAVCVYITGFALGYGPICWIVMAELFAPDVKSYCVGVVATSGWIFVFVVTKISPILAEIGLSIVFWIFCGCTIVACFFVGFLLPETKGKTIDEIQALLH